MDRVWGYLLRNLGHPDLAALRKMISTILPAPDDRLKAFLSAPRPEALMLFAAGLGTRMRPLTDHLPKPLIKVAGRALIDHALAQATGIDRVVVNIHYHADKMRAHLADRPGLLFSDESDRLLETGGGLKKALPLLASDPVLVLNTDAVWSGPSAQETLVRHWDPARMEALLLLLPRERALGHLGAGDFLLGDDGRLTRGAGCVYTGAHITRTGPISARPEEVFSLNPVWDRMAAEGRLFGVIHPGGWCDVGRPEAISLAEAMLRDV
jgi:MurNAc alpha-1-phosphate uridylyltransferase